MRGGPAGSPTSQIGFADPAGTLPPIRQEPRSMGPELASKGAKRRL
jgi:hypothetical protein